MSATIKKSTSGITHYLQCRDKAARMQCLRQMKQDGDVMPLSIAEDLLLLDLGMDERIAILEIAGSKDGRALEHFLTAHIFAWPQELAALAIRIWDAKTDHLLWFRLLAAARSPHIAQRVLYTIIECAHRAGGLHLIQASAELDGLFEFSPAFHAVVLQRATQWNFSHQRLTALALQVARDLTSLHPDNKALASALGYLARFSPEYLSSNLSAVGIAEAWRDLLRIHVQSQENRSKSQEKLKKLLAKPSKKDSLQQLTQCWPPVWERSFLSTDTVAQALSLVLDATGKDAQTLNWEFFAGIPVATLTAAISHIESSDAFAKALHLLGALLTTPTGEEILQQLKTHISKASDPAALMLQVPLRLRLELNQTSSKSSTASAPPLHTPAGELAALKAEEAAVLAGSGDATPVIFCDYVTRNELGVLVRSYYEDSQELHARKLFFALAHKTEEGDKRPRLPKLSTTRNDQFWSLLTDAWQEATENKLAPLAQSARQTEGVFRLCYLNTLGRFHGYDQAALKTLDFIRSKEEDDLRAVIYALGSIGTPRASMELVSSLTRPNITPSLQLEICQILQKQDLSNLQNEIRSAIQDLAQSTHAQASQDMVLTDLRDAMASLLHPTAVIPAKQQTSPSVPAAPASKAQVPAVQSSNTRNETPISVANDQQLDHLLTGKIAHYRELSSEVKRALRTSQFFHLQVSSTDAPGSIDLSPVIDMQYKALELLFREIFEEPCSRVIQRGILQRKLDVIGYARPIPRAMDEFEHYISALPIIREIPFFSLFKLRKMLRAICQFRPGKRFTLDGLKAFALFFLCFGRSECRYGLDGLFSLGFASDKELFEFCKALHILQDFRNRAAHEGFHPDASNDIDSIWRATAEIVQTAFKTRATIDKDAANDYAPRNRSTPIIERKVS